MELHSEQLGHAVNTSSADAAHELATVHGSDHTPVAFRPMTLYGSRILMGGYPNPQNNAEVPAPQTPVNPQNHTHKHN